ncbi:MAG: hypothetical protein KJP00_08465, partial [Bacteroidia bacterium]|nr:hypothetical protein [Bacteroidia bacterium]
LIGYCLLLNQIELRSDSLANVVKYSGKRFLFGIMILMWFYIASCGVVSKIMHMIHTALLPPKIQKQ